AMEEVSGPVIAVACVLSAVFIPCAFIGGITGQFFRQFALTIAVSTLISAFNSLTLSPALAARLLRPRGAKAGEPLPRVTFVLAAAALGFFVLGPALTPWLAPAAGRVLPEWVALHLPGVLNWAAAAVMVGAGWFAGRRLNRALAWFFHAFN